VSFIIWIFISLLQSFLILKPSNLFGVLILTELPQGHGGGCNDKATTKAQPILILGPDSYTVQCMFQPHHLQFTLYYSIICAAYLRYLANKAGETKPIGYYERT
jgi:hypothetical protein